MNVYRTAPARAESTHRLVLEGEFDLSNTIQARAGMNDILEPGSVVELDLGGVTFMDTAGARFLLWAGSNAQVCGGRVVLTAMSPPVQRLLVLAGADAGVRDVCHWTLAS